MCLAAIYFAGIDQVYYCASVEEAVDVGLGKSKIVYEDFQKPKNERTLSMVQMSLNEDQEDPMKLRKERRQYWER